MSTKNHPHIIWRFRNGSSILFKGDTTMENLLNGVEGEESVDMDEVSREERELQEESSIEEDADKEPDSELEDDDAIEEVEGEETDDE